MVADGINSNPCELKFLKLLTSWTRWLSRKLHFVGSGKTMAFVMLCFMLDASTFATCGTGIGFLSFSTSTGFLIVAPPQGPSHTFCLRHPPRQLRQSAGCVMPGSPARSQ